MPRCPCHTGHDKCSYGQIALLLCLAWAANAGAQDFWQPTGGPLGGRINTIAAAQSGVVFAGSEGGVLISGDNGGTWTFSAAGPNNAINQIHVDSQGTVFAATLSLGIYRSMDDGATWIQSSAGLPVGTAVQAVFSDTNDVVFAGTPLGVFRSLDNGQTWAESNNGLPTFGNAVHGFTIDLQNRIYCGSDNGVFRSSDAGANWIELNNGLTTPGVFALAVNSAGTLFAASSGGGVFRRTQIDTMWHQVSSGLASNFTMDVLVGPLDEIFVATSLGVHRSFDNGDNWTQTSTGITDLNIRSLAFDATGALLAATVGIGVFRSTNDGGTWTETNSGLTARIITRIFTDQNGDIILGTENGKLHRSSDGGATWTRISTISATNTNDVATAGGGLIFAAGSGGMYRSTNDGASFTRQTNGLNSSLLNAVLIDAAGTVFTGGSGGIFRSVDDGDTWTTVNNGLTSTNVTELEMNAGGTLFAGTLSGVFRSTNNGDNWTESGSGLAGQQINDLALDVSGDIFAGTVSGIYRSSDMGDSWSQILTGPTAFVAAIAFNPCGEIFVGTLREGMFHSTDDGASWRLVNQGLLHKDVIAIGFDLAGFAYAGTDGASVFRSVVSTVALPAAPAPLLPAANSVFTDSDTAAFSWSESQPKVDGYWFEIALDSTMAGAETDSNLTAVETGTVVRNLSSPQDYWWRVRARNLAGWGPFSAPRHFRIDIATPVAAAESLPLHHVLGQNYPNPFNPSTRISYSLANKSEVSLTVHNARGQLVRRLVAQEKPAGTHSVLWEGRDDDGRQVASGVYLYRLQAGDFVRMRKLILMR